MTSITRETCANCGRDRYKGTGPSWMTQHWPKVDLYSLHAPDCAINTPGKFPNVTVTSIWPDHNWQPATVRGIFGKRRDVCFTTRHDAVRHTSCGGELSCDSFRYCPYCGKALEAG